MRAGVNQSFRRPLLIGAAGASGLIQKDPTFQGSGDGVDTVYDPLDFDMVKDSQVVNQIPIANVTTATVLSGSSAYVSYGQSFTGDGSYITGATVKFQGDAFTTTIVYLKLYAHSGTYGSTGVPTGAALATSKGIYLPSLLTDDLYLANDRFYDPYKTTSGTNYFLQVEFLDPTYRAVLGINDSGITGSGNAAYKTTSGGAWTATTGTSLCYVLYGISGTYNIIRYNFTNGDTYVGYGANINSVKNMGVTFTGTSSYLYSFSVLAIKDTISSGNFTAKLYATSSNLPTGSALATSTSIDVNTEMNFDNNIYTFYFNTPYLMVNGTTYAMVIEYGGGTVSTDVYVSFLHDTTSSTYTGNTFYQTIASSTYTSYASTQDMCFYILTIPLVEAAFDTYDATANGDQYNYIAATQNTKMAQSFTGVAGAFSKVTFTLKASGSPTGNITASLFADDGGTFGTTGKPTGTALATSGTIAASTINTGVDTPYTFTFASPYTMTAGTIYWVAIEYSSGSSSNKIGVVVDISSPTAPGRCAYYNGTTWAFTTYDNTGTSGATDDMCYVLYALT